MNTLDAYKLPLKLDEFGSDIVWTEDTNRAFDFMECDFEDVLDLDHKIIVEMINTKDYPFKMNRELKYEDSYIWYLHTDKAKWVQFISIRGWGHLTGTGGLHLSEEKAAKIQDDFGKYIVDKLS